MRKPFRPNNDITQQYNSGLVKIYRTEDSAAPGKMPAAVLALKDTLFYEELRLGITRHYAGRQNQTEIERVIRVQKRDISSQDIAVTEDGRMYRIDLVQKANVWPASLDLTLVRVTQDYEVSHEVV